MQNLKSRRAYSLHCLRAHREGFQPMSYPAFVRFVLFNV